MKKIGKPWFHTAVSAAPVVFFFALTLVVGTIFAVFALLYIVIRHPLRCPRILGEMLADWKERVN